MAALRRRKRMEVMEPERATLLVRRIGVDTSPRDLIKFFARADFHVKSVRIGLQLGDTLRTAAPPLAEAGALVRVAKGEEVAAQKWADGQFWRGQRLEVEVESEYEVDLKK